MNFKLVHRLTAGIVFLISLIVLVFTMQPTVSFWDCGEFIAAGYALQIPHPPGAPFFLMLVRLFSMIPFADSIAVRANLISVFSSALSVLFVYLVSVKLIENYKGVRYALNTVEFKNKLEPIGVFVASAIGALSFSFSDTLWFNGVEAEVYALSTFLFAAIVWLILVWNEKADEPGSEKYLLLIGYLLGLSAAVHLMAVLAMVPIVMIIIFRKYLQDELITKKTAYIFLAHAGALLLIALILWGSENSPEPPAVEQYQAFDSKIKIIFAVISGIVLLVFRKQIFDRSSFYLPLMIGGVALAITYPGIVKLLPTLISSIAGNNIAFGIAIFILIFGGLFYLAHYGRVNNKPTTHLVSLFFVFILLGFTTYAMVIIRSNQYPPMNENEPETFKELVSYLNREQYGDFPTFKRRFATEPHQMVVYNNYSSDADFFWRYQMNHMMTRYWLWNYAGKSSWDQDSGPNIAPFNGIGNIIGKVFAVEFSGDVKDSLFGIPFLLGLIGLYYQFRKDWKMASVFLIMFVFMGYLTAFYQNQQQPQPRERDYFYVGAFFVFSVWISFGIMALIGLAGRLKSTAAQNAGAVAAMTFGVIFVPVVMLNANYHKHDRSNNYIPWDYSYNLLQSCAPNSVLFTNGDNDTFPLWYLQDVEAVRRDVKIVNLSLLNTDWYIRHMKNNDPYKVGVVDIRYSNEEIAGLRPIQWNATEVSLIAPKQGEPGFNEIQNVYSKDQFSKRVDTVKFLMRPTLQYGEIGAVRVQDIMVKEILEANNWKRPIYFSITCAPDSKIGLDNYLKLEGMAYRLVPELSQGTAFINEPVLSKQLLSDSKEFSKNYLPGLKFRGLNDREIFLDENHLRMTQNYRSLYFTLARYYIDVKKLDEANKTLDVMDQNFPLDVLPLEPYYYIAYGSLLADTKNYEKMNKMLALYEEKLADGNVAMPNNINPYSELVTTYIRTNQPQKAKNVMKRFNLGTDEQIDNTIKQIQSEMKRQDSLRIK